MYDIFDDIFDDGYGSNSYGMSDTDVDVELAFEAAMSSDYGYDDYDPAYEGFGDVMGKIGTKIADAARNMVRKIGEMFRKIGRWVSDKFAPLRAKHASGDNKVLQQVLKSLDGQVKNATGPRKAEIKQKVNRVKRAIMQSIDAHKRSIDTMNRVLNDSVSVFKAARTIGQSFIEKLNGAVAYGSEKGNTDDGNDLIDKMNSLRQRMASLNNMWDSATDDDNSEDINKIISEEMPGGSERLKEIIESIKFDKVNFKAAFAAEAELKVTCQQGSEAANRLETKLNDKYTKYEAVKGKDGKPTGRWAANGEAEIGEKDRFDDTSRQYLSALLANWNKFTILESEMSKNLTTFADSLSKSTSTTEYVKAKGKGGGSLTDIYGQTAYVPKEITNAEGSRYASGYRSTGSRPKHYADRDNPEETDIYQGRA